MQQFIPFEDEWDILERLSLESLIPYHVGVPCRHDLAAQDVTPEALPPCTEAITAAEATQASRK